MVKEGKIEHPEGLEESTDEELIEELISQATTKGFSANAHSYPGGGSSPASNIIEETLSNLKQEILQRLKEQKSKD